MCLNKVTKIFKPNDNMIVGYKIFDRDVYYHLRGYYENHVRKIGKHYVANNEKIGPIYGNIKYYDSGFHAFMSLKECIERTSTCFISKVICEVLLWDIRATGKQWNSKMVVGKNMMIMKRIPL